METTTRLRITFNLHIPAVIMTVSFIALGSNLNDRRKAIDDALRLLSSENKITVQRISPIYETVPEGLPPGSGDFLNAVVEIETNYTPHALLNCLQSIETKLGRPSTDKGLSRSRIIDLDILLFGDGMIDERDLIIPHPRMIQRWFVLKPLTDLCPDLFIPGQSCTVREALEAFEIGTQKVFP